MNPTRRQALLLALAGLGAALLGAGCGDDADPVPAAPTFDPHLTATDLPPTGLGLAALLAAWIGDATPAHIAAIGHVYLQRFAPERQAVIDDLANTVALVADLDDLDTAVAAWQTAALDDFDAVTVVAVSGWQLARTEARLCALAAALG